MTARRGAWLTLLTAAAVLQAGAPADAQTTDMSAERLDGMTAALGRGSLEERRAAAAALLSLGPEATPAIAQKLAALRTDDDGRAAAVVRTVRERASREPGLDWLGALLEHPPDAAVQHAATVIALVHALAHAGTTAAVRQIVLVGGDSRRAYRPEVASELEALGERAVAGLLEERRDPAATPDVQAWATSTLEAMGKRTPGDAVQTKDDRVLADVLHAYADTKDFDALTAVLSFVNSDRAQVRAAAREAVLLYGPRANGKLRETYAVFTGNAAPTGLTAAEVARELFAACDRARLQDVHALLDRGLAKMKDDDVDGAIADFDEVLARQPMLDRRAEMAPAYVARGERREADDRAAALAAFRKALRLDEATPDAQHVRGEIAYLEGEDLLARGIDDTSPFERALALDPRNARARAELNRLHEQVDSSRARAGRLLATGAVLALAVAGIVVARRRRPAPG